MCGNSVQTLNAGVSLFAYFCQKCNEYFICPAWERNVDKGSVKGKVAVCPYCRSNKIEALDTLLPLFSD